LVIEDVDNVANSSFLHECKIKAKIMKTKATNLIRFFIVIILDQEAFSQEIIKFTKGYHWVQIKINWVRSLLLEMSF